jgi:aralkylamine N-acetyltransferase
MNGDESYISKRYLRSSIQIPIVVEQGGGLIINKDGFRVELVNSWEKEPIIELYKTGGWWKEYMDASKIPELISGSYLFAVAIDVINERAVGMARVISDGIADAYIQDLVVLPAWREKGVGKMIVSKLLEHCRSRGISWIGLIAQPGTDGVYRSMGFRQMEGYIPMLFRE